MKVNWMVQGMRPKTLVAGLVPPIVSYAYFYKNFGLKEFSSFFLCLLLAVFIQIATNFYNDAIDFKKGADKDRHGPARVSSQLNINYQSVLYMGHLFIIFALLVGIPLVIKGGIGIAALGLISLFLAYGYTGGPFPLAYLGLGEVFVFLFFGLVATAGSYFIFSRSLSVDIILIGAQIGLLSSVLIAINNYRDRETDKLVHKNTLATKLNDIHYLQLIDFCLFFPYVILLYFMLTVDLKYFFPLFTIPLAYKIREGLREIIHKKDCNQYLALAAKHLLFFSVLHAFSSFWLKS